MKSHYMVLAIAAAALLFALRHAGFRARGLVWVLLGLVVNNAILIVHQSLYLLREEGMSPVDAIEEATRNRIRPIFMSTLTSVCGMLPLVLFPGAGSEFYRGLGGVVVGGLLISTIFTILAPKFQTICLKNATGKTPYFKRNRSHF